MLTKEFTNKSKRLERLGLASVVKECAKRGYSVAYPEEGEKYDLLIDFHDGKRPARVQIKATKLRKTNLNSVNPTAVIPLANGLGKEGSKTSSNTKIKKYTPDEIDYIAAYIEDYDSVYLFDIKELIYEGMSITADDSDFSKRMTPIKNDIKKYKNW